MSINKEDVQTYLDKGYVLGGRPHVNGDHRKGKIAVNKDNHTYFINPSELDIYLLNGYQKGGIPRSKDTAGVKRHWYNNGVENIMLNEANIYNARYGAYKYFIDFKGLINLVLKEDPNQLEK